MKTWHAQMGYQGYKSLLELLKLANEIEIKGTSTYENL